MNQIAKKNYANMSPLEIIKDTEAQANIKTTAHNSFGCENSTRFIAFVESVKNAIKSNAGLAQCDSTSFLQAVRECAADGVLPDKIEACLLPRNTKTGKKQCQYQIMTQGLYNKRVRDGIVSHVEFEVVYSKDKIEITKGTNAGINHTPKLDCANDERGEIVLFYAIVYGESFGSMFETMTPTEINKHRDRSDSYKFWLRDKNKPKPAWETDYISMARKTIIKVLLKKVPNVSPNTKDNFAVMEGDEIPEYDINSGGVVGGEGDGSFLAGKKNESPPIETASIVEDSAAVVVKAEEAEEVEEVSYTAESFLSHLSKFICAKPDEFKPTDTDKQNANLFIKNYGNRCAEVIREIEASSYLLGYTDSPVIFTLSWLFKKPNFDKVLAGDYRDKGLLLGDKVLTPEQQKIASVENASRSEANARFNENYKLFNNAQEEYLKEMLKKMQACNSLEVGKGAKAKMIIDLVQTNRHQDNWKENVKNSIKGS